MKVGRTKIGVVLCACGLIAFSISRANAQTPGWGVRLLDMGNTIDNHTKNDSGRDLDHRVWFGRGRTDYDSGSLVRRIAEK